MGSTWLTSLPDKVGPSPLDNVGLLSRSLCFSIFAADAPLTLTGLPLEGGPPAIHSLARGDMGYALLATVAALARACDVEGLCELADVAAASLG